MESYKFEEKKLIRGMAVEGRGEQPRLHLFSKAKEGMDLSHLHQQKIPQCSGHHGESLVSSCCFTGVSRGCHL